MIASPVRAQAPAAGVAARRDVPPVWVDVALGYGVPDDMIGLLLGTTVLLPSRVVVAGRAAVLSPFCIIGCPDLRQVTEAAALAGIGSSSRHSAAVLAVGISAVTIRRSADTCCDRPQVIRTRIGLPLQAQLAVHPLRHVGLAFTAFADLNQVTSTAGAVAGLQIGRFVPVPASTPRR